MDVGCSFYLSFKGDDHPVRPFQISRMMDFLLNHPALFVLGISLFGLLTKNENLDAIEKSPDFLQTDKVKHLVNVSFEGINNKPVNVLYRRLEVVKDWKELANARRLKTNLVRWKSDQ